MTKRTNLQPVQNGINEDNEVGSINDCRLETKKNNQNFRSFSSKQHHNVINSENRINRAISAVKQRTEVVIPAEVREQYG